jgi:hypothetical protein
VCWENQDNSFQEKIEHMKAWVERREWRMPPSPFGESGKNERVLVYHRFPIRRTIQIGIPMSQVT